MRAALGPRAFCLPRRSPAAGGGGPRAPLGSSAGRAPGAPPGSCPAGFHVALEGQRCRDSRKMSASPPPVSLTREVTCDLSCDGVAPLL